MTNQNVTAMTQTLGATNLTVDWGRSVNINEAEHHYNEGGQT